MLTWYNCLFGRGCFRVYAIYEYKEKLLLTCIVDGMPVGVFLLYCGMRKKIGSSTLWGLASGKGLHMAQEYIN